MARGEARPDSVTLVRNESLEIDPTDDCMSVVQIAESDAARPAHGIASQQSSGKKCLQHARNPPMSCIANTPMYKMNSI